MELKFRLCAEDDNRVDRSFEVSFEAYWIGNAETVDVDGITVWDLDQDALVELASLPTEVLLQIKEEITRTVKRYENDIYQAWHKRAPRLTNHWS